MNRNAPADTRYYIIVITERDDTCLSFQTVDEFVRALNEIESRKDVLKCYHFVGQRLSPRLMTRARYELISSDNGDKTFASVELPA